MIWVVWSLGFFSFLMTGEMTTPSDSEYDPAVHLGRSNIAVDNPDAPRMIRITIKQLKTDPFRKAINRFIGKTSTDLCPVSALLNYLTVRGLGSRAPFSIQGWKVPDTATPSERAAEGTPGSRPQPIPLLWSHSALGKS